MVPVAHANTVPPPRPPFALLSFAGKDATHGGRLYVFLEPGNPSVSIEISASDAALLLALKAEVDGILRIGWTADNAPWRSADRLAADVNPSGSRDDAIDPSTVRSYVSRMNVGILAKGANFGLAIPRFILTRRGKGYRLGMPLIVGSLPVIVPAADKRTDAATSHRRQ